MLRLGAFKTSNEQLTIEFQDTQLAQYRVEYQPDGKHFSLVADPHVSETQYRSPQLALWQFGDDEWVKIIRRQPFKVRKKRPPPDVMQQRLFAE